MREVDLSEDLLPRHREVFRLLGLLSHDWPDDDGFARCTLVARSAQVDLLCPDDATEDQLVAGEARSLAIPGGRRALEVAEPLTILLGDDWAPSM